MRVLMLTTNSSLLDGINRHILAIASSLNAMKEIQVAVCTTFCAGELNARLEQEGVMCYSLNAKSGHSFCVLTNFLHVMREFKPDILHIHVLPLFSRVIISCFYRRLPCVYTVHGLAVLGKCSKVGRRIIEILLKINIKCTIFISNGVKAFYNKGSQCYSNENSCVVYNPMDLCKLNGEKETLHNLLKLPQDAIVIGTACRIASVKNPILFTKTFCHILNQLPMAHAIIIGDGDSHLLCEMKNVVANFRVRDRVHFLGYRPNANELIAGLDCFVMTSQCEGMPTALLEAMASNVLVAFMRGGGGLQDLEELNEQHGPFACIANGEDDITLAQCVIKVLTNSEERKRYIQNASKIVELKFSKALILQMLMDVYKRVI